MLAGTGTQFGCETFDLVGMFEHLIVQGRMSHGQHRYGYLGSILRWIHALRQVG